VFFKSALRHYIIVDAPGHVEFLKNMVTGAARAHAALLVIDAQEGVRENSRRHGYLFEPADRRSEDNHRSAAGPAVQAVVEAPGARQCHGCTLDTTCWNPPPRWLPADGLSGSGLEQPSRRPSVLGCTSTLEDPE
jgi:hypothetical protein